jgi:pilus assembly protein CpaC
MKTLQKRQKVRSLRRTLGASLLSLACLTTWSGWSRDGIASSAAQGKHEEFNVAINETRTLTFAGVDRFSNGGPDSAEVRPDPANAANFFVTGKKQGTATLLLIRKDGSQTTYDITVSIRPIAVVEKELAALSEGTPGLRVRRVGPRFFIEGGVSTEADLKRIQQVAAIYGEQVVSLVVVGGGAAERKLLMRIDFFFVQYEKLSNYSVGLGWPSIIGGNDVITSNLNFDFLGRTTTAAQASISNQPLPKLDIGSRSGWAKVMKQSSLITGNGSEAKYSTGGEQNISQNQGLSVGVVTIRYGADLTVLPRYDSNSRDVELKVSSEISDLVTAAGGTIPGRTVTKLETIVTLKLGQALVLSGIKTQTKRQDITGIPFLSEIPVLGLLFGTHTKSEAEVEGAIFIIPSVVDTVPKSSLDVIKNAVSTYKDFAGEMKNLDTYPSQPPAAK